MLHRNKIILSAVMPAILCLSACDQKTLYHSYRPVPHEGWQQRDTFLFSVPVTDTLAPLRLYVEIRNREEYPYTNLFLLINNDTLECQLADEAGKWEGCGIGGIYQNRIPYRTLMLQHPDTLAFTIRHGMTDTRLEGIQDIGLCLER